MALWWRKAGASAPPSPRTVLAAAYWLHHLVMCNPHARARTFVMADRGGDSLPFPIKRLVRERELFGNFSWSGFKNKKGMGPNIDSP